jgi:UMF1 family MFS transporter
MFTFLFPQQRLKQRAVKHALPAGTNPLKFAFKQLWQTLTDMRQKYPSTLRYLIAYLIYNDGIQTVIAVSTIFAARELGAGNSELTLLVLEVQFVAFGGAFFFGWLASKLGAKRTIMITLVIWSGLVIYAFAMLDEIWELWIMGAVLALVLGGSQALSRSLFSQMIPEGQEAEYFGFYEISERGTAWMGPLFFGLMLDFTGSARISIALLIVFFVTGLILLAGTNVRQAIEMAGNEVPRVV